MSKEENNPNKCPICGRPTHKESKYCIFHASAEEKNEEEFKMILKEYIEKIKEGDKDYNFERFVFIGGINFRKDLDIIIFKNADFRGTIFEGNADFMDTIFEGNASFMATTFKGDASFWGAIFEGDASLRDTTFEGDASFWRATFKGDASFWRATFEEDAYFMATTFKGNASFMATTFKGDASFWGATFKGDAYFKGTTFKGNADFKGAHFKIYTDFKGTTFEGDASFKDVTFGWYTIFRGVTFGGDSEFGEATFENDAEFGEATFENDADFSKATFKEYANFREATFKGDADFRVKPLVKGVTLAKIKVLSGKKLNLKVSNSIKIISLERAYLENTYLDIELVEGILIDFTGASLKNTKIKKNQIKNHILQEKKKKFYKAQEIYLLLKNNFHSIGQYEDESWAFTKERDMERMSKSFYAFLNKYKKYSLFKKILMQSSVLKRVIVKTKIFKKWLSSKRAVKWFNLKVSDFIYQYGENPWRVIRFALIIIFLFAIILNFSGIVNSDRTNLIIEFIKESQGDEYTLSYLGPILGSFLNCLYFSVVTFTTLGYGDFQPAIGLSRFFVSLESIIGAITMALFVYTFARRTGGR